MRRKDDEKAQRIKEAVIQVVLEEGFADASISKIARCAGVSQATVYVYHESKESMLRSVYSECAEELWEYLVFLTEGLNDGRRIIEELVGGYYRFMTEHEQLFRFVEQFSSCPALTSSCSQIEGLGRMIRLLQQWEDAGIFKPYHVVNLFGMIFTPVKMLTEGAVVCGENEEVLLKELIAILQGALLSAAC